MSVEENKSIINRYVETWNRGDVQALTQFWSPDLVNHTREKDCGFEETKGIVTAFKNFFPDMQFTLEDVIAEDDRVMSRMTWTATHSTKFMGGAASGRKVTCTVIGIARIVDGKIVEHWGVTDELAMLAQMGLLPEDFHATAG